MQKLLISGPGLIGKRHISLSLDNKEIEIVGIVAPRSADNQQYANDVGVPLYKDFELGIKRSGATSTVISSPNAEHFQQAKVALEAGIPVLVEKPITDKLSTAHELTKLVEKTATPLLVGHHRTHSPFVEAASRYLTSGEFGQPVAMTGTALFYKPSDYFINAPWRTVVGGGPLLINLIHEIGLWRMLVGEIEEVSAFVSKSQRKFEVEDGATISIRFENKALGSFILSDAAASSKSWEMTSGENSDFPHYENDSAYHFAGSRGSLDFPNLRTMTYSNQKSWLTSFKEGKLEVDRTDPLKAQLKHFVRVANREVEPLVSAIDGYKNVLVLEAIRESARFEKAINISEFEKAYTN